MILLIRKGKYHLIQNAVYRYWAKHHKSGIQNKIANQQNINILDATMLDLQENIANWKMVSSTISFMP